MEPSHHDHKYDRQIRLWGSHGQQELESAKILVLGSGPIASEYIKSLVLANVGGFVVMDNGTVSTEDVGNNFFVAHEDIGSPRATAIARLLGELNPDCCIESIVRDPKTFIECCHRQADNDDMKFLKKFHLVIATEIPLQHASSLCELLYANNTAFLHARSFGLIAALRMAIDEHTVVETHPDSDMNDLYLHQSQLKRFPELDQFLSSFDLFNPNPDEFYYSHIPFPAILVQLFRKFRSQNPESTISPAAFKSFISSHDRFKSSNFEEALRYSHYVLRDPKYIISPELQAVLSDPKAKHSSSKPSPFWILVRALKEFIQNEGGGFLPVSPGLPDMTAETSSYIAIKKLYSDQSLRDRNALTGHCHRILKSFDLPENYVPAESVELFVKNCRSLHVSRMRDLSHDLGSDCDEVIKSIICESLAEEIDGLDAVQSPDSNEIEQPPNDIHWYIAMKCADVFYSQHQRYPGDCSDSSLEYDVTKMKAIAADIFKSVGLGTDHINEKSLEEIVRFGSSSVHNTAAIIAGIAAQESLKLLTKQYIPFNNLCLWNGVHATLARWTV